MIRLAELLLLFAPLAVFVVWRVWTPGKVPSVGAIVGMGIGLAILAGGLVWLRFQDAAPRDAVYIPSHMQNGKIVPERQEP